MKRVLVSSDQRSARVFGVLFLISFATSIPALALLQPVLDDPVGYAANGGSENQIFFGVVLELLLIIANIGTASVVYPILKRENHILSLGYVTARIVECTFILAGILAVLSIVTLSQENAGVDEGAIAHTLAALKDWTFHPGARLVVGWGNGLILGYLMYRSGLVPLRRQVHQSAPWPEHRDPRWPCASSRRAAGRSRPASNLGPLLRNQGWDEGRGQGCLDDQGRPHAALSRSLLRGPGRVGWPSNPVTKLEREERPRVERREMRILASRSTSCQRKGSLLARPQATEDGCGEEAAVSAGGPRPRALARSPAHPRLHARPPGGEHHLDRGAGRTLQPDRDARHLLAPLRRRNMPSGCGAGWRRATARSSPAGKRMGNTMTIPLGSPRLPARRAKALRSLKSALGGTSG